jgi:hypothetical protein
VLVGCGGPQPIAERSEQADTSTVDLSHPTVVGYFLYSEREVYNDPALRDALGAFQGALDRARGRLQESGIQVVETYRDSMRLKWEDGRTKTYVTRSREDGRIGYHFFLPGGTPVNVPTPDGELDLVAEAQRYLLAPLACRSRRGSCLTRACSRQAGHVPGSARAQRPWRTLRSVSWCGRRQDACS